MYVYDYIESKNINSIDIYKSKKCKTEAKVITHVELLIRISNNIQMTIVEYIVAKIKHLFFNNNFK